MEGYYSPYVRLWWHNSAKGLKWKMVGVNNIQSLISGMPLSYDFVAF